MYGGTDRLGPCLTGASSVYTWDSSAIVGPSSYGAWYPSGNLAFPRWYGFPLQTGWGDVLITGNSAQPEVSSYKHEVASLPGWAFDNFTSFSAPCQPAWENAFPIGGYPFLHWVKAGFAFLAGPQGSLTRFGCPQVGQGFVWSPAPANGQSHESGNSVILERWLSGGRHESVYVIGGEACGSSSVEVIYNPAPGMTGGWMSRPPMCLSREDASAVVTPDGRIVVVGGLGWNGWECVPRLHPEVYNPASEFDGSVLPWTTLSPQSQARTYHSVALLLQDGRILSAGGVGSPHTAEIFTPPYLTTGIPQSTAQDAPASVGYSDPSSPGFTIHVGLGAWWDTISKVALVRPGSVTHGADFNQRWVELLIEGASLAGLPGIPILLPGGTDDAPSRSPQARRPERLSPRMVSPLRRLQRRGPVVRQVALRAVTRGDWPLVDAFRGGPRFEAVASRGMDHRFPGV